MARENDKTKNGQIRICSRKVPWPWGWLSKHLLLKVRYPDWKHQHGQETCQKCKFTDFTQTYWLTLEVEPNMDSTISPDHSYTCWHLRTTALNFRTSLWNPALSSTYPGWVSLTEPTFSSDKQQVVWGLSVKCKERRSERWGGWGGGVITYFY